MIVSSIFSQWADIGLVNKKIIEKTKVSIMLRTISNILNGTEENIDELGVLNTS